MRFGILAGWQENGFFRRIGRTIEGGGPFFWYSIMWQRFTEHSRKTIYYAQEEAQRFGEKHLSPEHLLLALLRKENVAGALLVKLGTSPQRVRDEITQAMTKTGSYEGSEMALTPESKRVIDLAYQEARQLGNEYIGTEHLLLGLIAERQSKAGQVLHGLGITIENARKFAKELQTESQANQLARRPSPPPTSPYDKTLAIHPPTFGLAASDQLLLSLLCNPQEPFTKELLKIRPDLAAWIPALLIEMQSERAGTDRGLDALLSEAARQAESENRDWLPEDIYRLGIENTGEPSRDLFTRLGLTVKGDR